MGDNERRASQEASKNVWYHIDAEAVVDTDLGDADGGYWDHDIEEAAIYSMAATSMMLGKHSLTKVPSKQT